MTIQPQLKENVWRASRASMIAWNRKTEDRVTPRCYNQRSKLELNCNYCSSILTSWRLLSESYKPSCHLYIRLGQENGVLCVLFLLRRKKEGEWLKKMLFTLRSCSITVRVFILLLLFDGRYWGCRTVIGRGSEHMCLWVKCYKHENRWLSPSPPPPTSMEKLWCSSFRW